MRLVVLNKQRALISTRPFHLISCEQAAGIAIPDTFGRTSQTADRADARCLQWPICVRARTFGVL